MPGRYKSLTMQDRHIIAKRYMEEARAVDIAQEVGVHPATIYDELRRGAVTDDSGGAVLDQNQRPKYDPELAQRRVQEARKRRGKRKAVPAASAAGAVAS